MKFCRLLLIKQSGPAFHTWNLQIYNVPLRKGLFMCKQPCMYCRWETAKIQNIIVAAEHSVKHSIDAVIVLTDVYV